MELLLMRHADAVDGNGDDFARTLSANGRRQAEKMGGRLAAILEGGVCTVVSSPYPRAMQTADIVTEAIGASAAQMDERLASGMTPDLGSALVHEFGAHEACVLLVGHAPDLGLFASHLIGAENPAVEMRKAAVACFETARAGFGGSMLKWLITPKI